MNNNFQRGEMVLVYLYLLFLVSLVFSLRFVNSLSIGCILIAAIFFNRKETGTFYNANLKNLFLLSCFLFYLLQFAGVLYAHDQKEGWDHIRLKSSLAAIPLSLSFTNCFTDKMRQKLLKAFFLILAAASLYCLFMASRSFIKDHDRFVFFYHSLVKPLSQHAIQFSILIFVALVSLFENMRKNQFYFTKSIDGSLVIFFSFFILLLSSKLVISFYALYLVYFFLFSIRSRPNRSFFVIIAVVLSISFGSLFIFSHNPVSKRFSEVLQGNLDLIRHERFNPGHYFNGLQFRLLQWRFVSEILNEEKSWLIGVSPGDAQSYLDQKYISENMYIGTPERGDKGYLGYNTHNQFLEALLQSGIIGLAVFLMICVALIKMVIERKNNPLSFITILLLAYSFTESLLETQFSLVIFLFFPLFFYLDKTTKHRAINS